MQRNDKAEFIDRMRGAFAASPFVILTDYKGATVAELDTVRRKVEEAGASFAVVKNTLCRIAVTDAGMAPLAEHFRGNIGVVFSGDDLVATARAFRDLRKSIPKLEPRAGFFEGELLDIPGVEGMVDMPTQADLLGMLQAPARSLLYLFSALASKLEEQGA